jgi:sugar transferase (PEP-CTERM system associated)
MIRVGGQKVPTRTILFIASDAFFVIVGLLLVTALRFRAWSTIHNYLRDHLTIPRFGLVVLVTVVGLYYNELYDAHILRHRHEAAVRLVQAVGFIFLVLAVIYYLDPDLSLGRGIAMLAAPTILSFAIAWRWLLEATGLLGTGAERVLLLGTGQMGITLVREIIARPELNLKVVGFLDEQGQNIGKSLVNPCIIGATSEVEKIAKQEKVDRVILSLTERRGRTPIPQLLQLKFDGVGVQDAESLYESISGRIMLENLWPSWLILSNGFRKPAWLRFLKRAIDLFVSIVALALLWPVLALVGLAILLETGRPIFFRQERVGMTGRHFQILKFRSMYQDAEANGPVWAASADNRITRVGRFLRKYRLDEIPQLFNVLRGEMSLVGPRPERPIFCQLLAEQIPYYTLRHSVRPGITGWAQIKYQYSASVEETKQKLEFDIFYVKHLSMLLDLAILFETAKVMVYGHGSK